MSYPIQFGKYLLLERIAVGGMAEVFKAKAFGVEGFERILAIKRILPNMADDDEFINMFVDEARIAVQFSHANIVQIYELGKYENQYYIAMEYVSGRDLRQILDNYRKRKEVLPLPVASFLVSKICDGLDYAHRKSDPSGKALHLIHRDVSPQNILVSYEGAVKITDFGIAKAEDRASKTQAGVLKGKFGYMSPEQVRGLEIDHRSDIFAVGILMYEMLTNKRLFLGDSDFSTLEKVRNAEVTPPSQHNPDIPAELERIMLKALAKERDERYQWCAELHDDLQQFLIEDNTIFNAKRLAAFLAHEYADDIKAEMHKMEEYMRMPPPSSPEALAAVQEAQAAPMRTDPGEHQGEKTMIFESGFADDSGPDRGRGEAATGELEAIEPAPRRPSPGRGSPNRGAQARAGQRASPARSSQPRVDASSQRHVGALLIAGAAFVSLLILLIFVLAGGGVGTIVVTSTPVPADIFLDGEPLGATPVTRTDVPVGGHVLVAQAPGYPEQAYTFELDSARPAHIAVTLQRAVTTPTFDAVIEVVTDPPGASVRIGGLPKGVTPLTIADQDPTRPVILEIAKDGFQTEMRTVTFDTGQNRQSVRLPLRRVAASDGRGRVSINSNPPGATVYIGRQVKGETPLDVGDLDVGTPHEVEVMKDGFRPYKEVVQFAGESSITLQAELEPFDKKPRKERKDKPREKEDKREKPRAKGGACSGSTGKMGVMPIGVPDCKVTVGGVDLGVAPFFKKPSPSGRCEVEVTCPGGKQYATVRTIRAGEEEKIIIKDGDWE